jgi:ABC-type lipoprotein export system ATPase subunit
MEISQFCVYKLYGNQNIEINIHDNRIVIVGVNGIGKSTVINIFYHLIARRWKTLAEFDFDRISLRLNDHVLTLSRKEIIDFLHSGGSLPRVIRNRLQHRTSAITTEQVLHTLLRPTLSRLELEQISKLLGMPPVELANLRNRYRAAGDVTGDLFPTTPNFLAVADYLKTAIDARILFLPTYRRIEKDLKAIVPDIEQRVRSYEERYGRSSSDSDGGESRPYIDLVEFGMQDVKSLIEGTLLELNRFSRDQLNKLTGAYLGEVIRGDVDNFDVSSVASFTEAEISAILDRVEERTLSQSDKQILLRSLTHIHEDPLTVDTRERYSAHFFARLADVARAMEALEAPIMRFVEVCNKNYLFGKTFRYNKSEFTLSIDQHDTHKIQLEQLSSGEKQIVSLFCHVYLSRHPKFILIIDEPELSLSVDWQSSFLPDIMGTGKCSFIAAVTHSPFIYDNAFDAYAIDLLECITHC